VDYGKIQEALLKTGAKMNIKTRIASYLSSLILPVHKQIRFRADQLKMKSPRTSDKKDRSPFPSSSFVSFPSPTNARSKEKQLWKLCFANS
jgi:hypothetical protein